MKTRICFLISVTCLLFCSLVSADDIQSYMPSTANPKQYRKSEDLPTLSVMRMFVGDSVDQVAHYQKISPEILAGCREKVLNSLLSEDVSMQIANWGSRFIVDPVSTANATPGVAGEVLRQSAVIVDTITAESGPPIISCLAATSKGRGSRECVAMVEPVRRTMVKTLLASATMSKSIVVGVTTYCGGGH